MLNDICKLICDWLTGLLTALLFWSMSRVSSFAIDAQYWTY